MQTLNRMTLRFDSRSVNEAFARMTVAAFIAQLDPTLEELNDIKTVVSEAVTNAIVHGYRDKVGQIVVSARLLEGGFAEIKVKDHGCGIPDIEQARQPLFTTGDAERSGMGFTIMESFSDKLRVRSAVGRGTTVTMLRQIMGRSGEPV
ncbi:MAG: anti-sigma F factor [Butyricicoccus pullicaecorum]|nr:anti-sigma F factor [Butyricicoccus pullicaecorum]MDO4669604.1 anti-sigma F factor [Butyricicoccus pullicaecorum]